MKKSGEVNLGSGSVGKALMTLAIPAILSQLVNLLYNMVDRMYIGHIDQVGSIALTGLGVTFPIIMIISACSFLFGACGAPRASIYMGKQDNKTAEKILGNCFISLVISALVLTVLVLCFAEPVLMLFGASENTLPYALSYINIYAIGTICVMLTLGMNQFISAQGFSKVSMMTVVIGAVINIILDPIFIFGLNMGVRGAALATILSQGVSAIWTLRFLTGKETTLHLRKENFQVSKEILLPCISLGIAPFAMQSTESILVLCFNSSLLKYGGDVAVGTMTILSSVMQFGMLPLQGITQGGQPLISYNFGAKNGNRVKKAFKLQTLACVAYTATIFVLVMLVPQMFIKIFTPDLELISMATWAIRIYMACIILMGVQVSCQQTFIAFGNAKVSAFLAIFRKIIVLIPLIYILPVFLSDKVFAVFLAEPIADVIAVTTTTTLFIREYKMLDERMAQM